MQTTRPKENHQATELKQTELRPPAAPPQKPASPLAIAAKSQAVRALLLVVLANLALVVTNPFKNVDPDSLPTLKSWVFWTTQDFAHQKPPAKVALLGSSLLMNSVWMQEAEHIQKPVDIVINHRTTYLESVLKSYIPTYSGPAFNFGLPGGMVSDDYMLSRTQFVGERIPKVVVLCLGPRDLMDTSFSCAGATTPFKYLERYTDTRDLLDLAYTSTWPKINYLLREAVYFVGKKWHSQIFVSESTKSLLKPEIENLSTKSPLNQKTDWDKQFAFYRSEVEKGVFIAKPNVQTVGFFDNGKDWKKRFKNPNDAMFKNQLTWLNMTVDLLHSKGVTPVIVNMPMSKLGLSVVPPGIYERHVSTLEKLAADKKLLYVDTMKEGKFEADDFTDYGHMDASGGKKIVDIIGRAMANDPTTRAILTGGGH